MILSLEDNKGGKAVLLDTRSANAQQTPSAPALKTRMPTLYLDAAADSGNELTLTLTTAGGEIPSLAAGASLQFDLPRLLVDEDRVQPSAPDGWRVTVRKDTHSGSTGWLMTSDRALATDQGLALRFGFKGLRGDAGAQPLGTLIVTPANFAGLEDHRFGLRTPVALVNAPTGQLRELDIQVTWVGSNTVVPTEPGQALVANRLTFALLNPSDRPVVAPDLAGPQGQQPTFSVHFIYAGDTSGRGALCSPDFARARATPLAPAPTLRATDGPWTCTPQVSPSGPYWTVQPQDSNHALLAAHERLELVFDGVASDLGLDAQGDADVTPMIVLWQNIPGCLPGSVCLPVLKTNQLRILSFASDRPFGMPVKWGDKAKLSWRTLGAERSHVLDSLHPETIADQVGDGPHEVEVVLDQVDVDRRFQVFAYRGTVEVPGKAEAFAAIEYPPLHFKQPLSVTPDAGLTRVISGVTREGRPVVGPVQELTLRWAMESPQLVKAYTLMLNGRLWKEFGAIDIPPVDGQHTWVVDMREQDQTRASAFEFTLVVHALHGADCESKARFESFDPISGLQLDIVPVPPTQSVVMDWGLLLYNQGASCRCEFRVSSDPAQQGATSWKLQFAENDQPGQWQCVLSDNQGSKTTWQRELGASVKVTWPALNVNGRASDCADFFYQSLGGGTGVVKSLDRHLVGMRLQWPADVVWVNMPDERAMAVKPFKLLITQGLGLQFQDELQPFTVYHNRHWTSGVFIRTDHDDPVANTTNAPTFNAIDATNFPRLGATGWFEFTDVSGAQGRHSMKLSLELGRSISASLVFTDHSGDSDPVALAVLPPV